MPREYNPVSFIMMENKLIENAFYRVNLTARQWRVLWVFIRHTLGYGDFSTKLTYRDISHKTSLKLRHAHEVVQELIDMNIIQSSRTKFKTRKTEFTINLDYESWKVDFHKSEIRKLIELNLQNLK